MSEAERVQRWRQRQRDAGKEHMSLWLSHATKLRLEDLAATSRYSPSELVEQALAQFHPSSSPSSSIVADMELLRTLVQEVLAESQAVTAFVTDTVTATLARDLPTLVRQLVEGLALEALGLPVTDTNGSVTDIELPGKVKAVSEPDTSPRPTPREEILLGVSEDLVKIVEARRQYPDISERAFTQLLFDQGIYRHRAKDGSEGPIPHSTLRDWWKRAREAGLL